MGHFRFMEALSVPQPLALEKPMRSTSISPRLLGMETNRHTEEPFGGFRSSRTPRMCCGTGFRISISWSCRTAIIRRRRPNWPIWCCRPRSGARKKAPTRTPSAASAK